MSEQEHEPYMPEYNGKKAVDINSAFVIDGVDAWMDGGSVTVYCCNEAGVKFVIHFQHYLTGVTPGHALPGRLFFAGAIVEVRSALERQLLSQLEKALKKSTEGREFSVNEQELIQEVIDYVRSQRYVDFDRKTQAILASQKK